MCHFRQLTLFIMFTVNSQWEEIQQKLFSDQTAVNQSDLMTQIFHLKLTDLLQLLWVYNEIDAQLIMLKYKKNTMKRKRRALYRDEKIECFSLKVLVSN